MTRSQKHKHVMKLRLAKKEKAQHVALQEKLDRARANYAEACALEAES